MKDLAGDNPQKRATVDALRQAIADYSHKSTGSSFIDLEEEEALAPVKAAALRLLNQRPRSEHELRQRLYEKDFSSAAVEEVINRCLRNDMLNDRTFAFEWVRQRHTHQNRSIALLRRELQGKGVENVLIEEALATIDPEEQLDAMVALLEKKASALKEIPTDYKEYQKALKRILGVAVRKGFPESQALMEARRLLDERIEELRASSFSFED